MSADEPQDILATFISGAGTCHLLSVSTGVTACGRKYFTPTARSAFNIVAHALKSAQTKDANRRLASIFRSRIPRATVARLINGDRQR